MKIVELQKVPEDKVGRFNKNGCHLESHEEDTFRYLTLFGFDISAITPAAAKGVSNPDIFMLNSIWEAKTPTSHNENTIQNRFKEASCQAAKVIFDLRFVKSDADKVEKQVISLFKGNSRVRRLMIIEKSGEKILDMMK